MRKHLSLLLAVAMLFSLALPALAEEPANYDDQIMLISDHPDEAIAAEEDIAQADPVYAVEEDTGLDGEADDIPEKTPMWYDAAVAAVTEKGIMTGTDKGFEPDATVTRATVFQTIYNMEGQPAVPDQLSTFADVPGKWYEPAAHWAQSVGLAVGTGEGFEGDRAVTRAEVVVILERYAQYKTVDMTAWDDVELLATYVDAELLTSWSVRAFRWAVGAGVISGKTVDQWTVLAPNDNATRAELAQILVNFTDFFTPSVQ